MRDQAAGQVTKRLPSDVSTMLDEKMATCWHWPVSVDTTRRLQSDCCEDLLKAIKSAEDAESCDAILLVANRLLTETLSIVQAATVIAAAEVDGTEIFGGPAEVAFLRDGSADGAPPASRVPTMLPIIVARRPLARSIVSTLKYNRPRDVPGALMQSNHLLVAHNPTVIEYLRNHPKPLRFLDSGTLFHRALKRGGSHANDRADARHLVAFLIPYLLASVDLPEPYTSRVLGLVEAKIGSILSYSLAHIRALARVSLPEVMWGSSGAQYASRSIATQIRRRGGQTLFGVHAGTSAAVDIGTSYALQEFSVASSFVLPTQAIADEIEMKANNRRLDPLPTAQLLGGYGVPSLREPLPVRRPGGARPRVLYVSTILRGFATSGRKPLADPVYLDWQLRLARWLNDLPIELLCKPHPGGVMTRRRHPIEALAPTSYVPFETLIADTDVFVFDNCTTTTLWEAVCTDRPIVYFDMKLFRFTALAEPLLRQRCRFVDVHFDDANRPQFDRQEAEEALMAGGQADPSALRSLFLG